MHKTSDHFDTWGPISVSKWSECIVGLKVSKFFFKISRKVPYDDVSYIIFTSLTSMVHIIRDNFPIGVKPVQIECLVHIEN